MWGLLLEAVESFGAVEELAAAFPELTKVMNTFTNFTKAFNIEQKAIKELSDKTGLGKISKIFSQQMAKFKIDAKIAPEFFAKYKSQREQFIKQLEGNAELSKKEISLIKRVLMADDKEAIEQTAVESSWISTIEWVPMLSTLRVETKDGASFQLPFFQRSVAQKIISGAVSPGKSIWTYWKSMGRGADSGVKVETLASKAYKALTAYKPLSKAHISQPKVRASLKGIKISMPKLKLK